MPRPIRARSTWRRAATEAAPFGGRTVQDDGRRQHGSRALSRRGPALTDLLGGQVQVMFATTVSSIEYIRAGRLRALAVTTATRSDVCRTSRPWASSCRATRRARGTASARQGHAGRDHREAQQGDQRGLADPKMKARLADLGVRRFQARPPTSASSSPTKPRSGQGGQVRRHQGRVIRALTAKTFHKVPIGEYRSGR